jgi:hypothetical protein
MTNHITSPLTPFRATATLAIVLPVALELEPVPEGLADELVPTVVELVA